MVVAEYSKNYLSTTLPGTPLVLSPQFSNVCLSAFAFGLATRFGLHNNPDSKGIYIAEDLLVVLSPCGFIAANYVLLGRLARWLGCDQYLLVPARRITLIFVCSDVGTFLVQVSLFPQPFLLGLADYYPASIIYYHQATGGSISISKNPTTAKLGSHVSIR